MPQHNPEDRVRVKNIVTPDADDIQTMWTTRQRKVKGLDANGNETTKEVPYELEFEWNFAKGFLFFWGGKAYTLGRDAEKEYPRFLADHCIKGMVDYILTAKHLKSKRTTESGLDIYDKNILGNEVEKKRLRNLAMLGVSSWYDGEDEDFDALLNKQFGGDVDSMIAKKNNEDFELPTEDDEPIKVKLKQPEVEKTIPQSKDVELQKLRDECSATSVDFTEGDTVSSLKAKLLKEFA